MTGANPPDPRLREVDDAELRRLGFRPDDAEDALRVIDEAFASGRQPSGDGVPELLALLATADDARGRHRSFGVPDAVSDATLADLGRQAWVHRRTFGSFGLHTHEWVALVWSGRLYRLGRLQFELRDVDGEPVLSVHIPEDGPLDPAAVAASFGAADRFFAEHFPVPRARRFHCASWLLDPRLAAALDPASNIARFQALWTIVGDPAPGDEDAIFFVFRRRGDVDRAELPRRTSLQRAVLDRLDAGGHWSVREGLRDGGSA